jgi:hypothetical protein
LIVSVRSGALVSAIAVPWGFPVFAAIGVTPAMEAKVSDHVGEK